MPLFSMSGVIALTSFCRILLHPYTIQAPDITFVYHGADQNGFQELLARAGDTAVSSCLGLGCRPNMSAALIQMVLHGIPFPPQRFHYDFFVQVFPSHVLIIP
jgi:hypothetical protein